MCVCDLAITYYIRMSHRTRVVSACYVSYLVWEGARPFILCLTFVLVGCSHVTVAYVVGS